MKSRYKGLILQIQTRRNDSYTIQQPPDVRRSVLDTDEIVSQLLDDQDGLGLLDRSLVFGNQDCFFRPNEYASVSLICQHRVGSRELGS